jgi:AraC-like DNA-binding protein
VKKNEFESVILIEAAAAVKFPRNFLSHYNTHLLCHRGNAEFVFNDYPYKCKAGEFVFWFANSRVTNIVFSKSFKASVLLVEEDFLNSNIPDQSRSIDATLHSREFPVLHLDNQEDRKRISINFKLLHERYLQKEHRYYKETLKLQMRLFILEMWHTFANEFENRKRTLLGGSLYERFITLVQEHCVKEREVKFYADQLHITPKHLNVISKLNSGITASEWIQRFVKERIQLFLENKSINIAEIADNMEFSSRSFFTRYVKKVLGLTPSEYRNRMR